MGDKVPGVPEDDVTVERSQCQLVERPAYKRRIQQVPWSPQPCKHVRPHFGGQVHGSWDFMSSSASTPAHAHDSPEPAPITDQDVGEYREQDRFLPVSLPLPNIISTQLHAPKIANVSRIMKASVPPTAKIAKDAKECVQECVSEFISFITSEAAEKCQLEKRKTIGGEDILYAMATLGFDNYAETLKIHLAKLRQHQSTTSAAQVATLSTRELPQRDMDD